jgi:hypothetical protein
VITGLEFQCSREYDDLSGYRGTSLRINSYQCPGNTYINKYGWQRLGFIFHSIIMLGKTLFRIVRMLLVEHWQTLLH